MAVVTQKPKIQYIGQFYVYGSEAKAPAIKEKKKPKTKLPQAQPEAVREIVLEPLALGSIVVTVVLFAAMALTALQLHSAWQEYHVMADYVDRLTSTNVQLLEEYRSGYNLDDIEAHAQTLGMVPSDQAKTVTIYLTPGKPQQEQTLWDDILWFFEGLFA